MLVKRPRLFLAKGLLQVGKTARRMFHRVPRPIDDGLFWLEREVHLRQQEAIEEVDQIAEADDDTSVEANEKVLAKR
jgi:hypothetical protein